MLGRTTPLSRLGELNGLDGTRDDADRAGNPLGLAHVSGFDFDVFHRLDRAIDHGSHHGQYRRGPARAFRPGPSRLIPISRHAQTIGRQRHKARIEALISLSL